MKFRCQGKTRYFGDVCQKTANVERDGRHYCWQHDPERLEAKAKAQWEARKAEMARADADHDARIERRRLLERAGMVGLSNDDLRRVAALGGVMAMVERIEKMDEAPK